MADVEEVEDIGDAEDGTDPEYVGYCEDVEYADASESEAGHR